MARCIVRYPDTGEAPPGDLARVVLDQDIEMIDQAGRGLALLEVPEQALPRLRELLPGWRIGPEQEGKLP